MASPSEEHAFVRSIMATMLKCADMICEQLHHLDQDATTRYERTSDADLGQEAEDMLSVELDESYQGKEF